jgi:Tfp pilus assembly protein PilN
MLITNGTIVQSGVRRRTIQRQVSLGPVTLRIVTIIVFAAAALIALAQSTTSATKAYELTKADRAVAQEQQKVNEMETEATRLQALQSIIGTEATPTPSPDNKLEASQKIDALPSTPAQISQMPATAN